MSKLLVIDQEKDTEIPFLRGMLVKSLQRSGLDFVDAYNLANEIREDLEDVDAITTEELRERIIEALAENYPGKVLNHYQKATIFNETIEILMQGEHTEAFSRGIFVTRLLNSGISIDRAGQITRQIHAYLIREKTRTIPIRDLITLTYEHIMEHIDRQTADDYLVWCGFQRQNKPLLILLGGVPGSGKSTIATELANRLSIIRTQSTDMLREVMRALIPKRLSPALHSSSFSAGKAMHHPAFVKENSSDALISGFNTQSDMVAVACEAIISRAINESVSVILEGVHMRPNMFRRYNEEDAVVIPVILAVSQKKRLKRNLTGRSSAAEKRSAKRYLNHLSEIWQLQEAILSDADEADIEIIDNHDHDETINEICKVVTQTLTASYKGKLQKLRSEFSVKQE